MSDFISSIFANFSAVITGSAQGLKDAFLNIFWADPSATNKSVSDLMLFVATMMGLTIGIGILYKVLSLVRIGRK